MKLDDLVGTRHLTEIWVGERWDSGGGIPRPIVDDEVDHQRYPKHRAAALVLDGLCYVFDSIRLGPVDSGLSTLNVHGGNPISGATFNLSRIATTIESAQVDMLVEVRRLKIENDWDIIYATDENNEGRVVLEIGDIFSMTTNPEPMVTNQSFWVKWKPEGFTPSYLERIDDGPEPVEIVRGKALPEPKSVRGKFGGGRAPNKVGAKLPPPNAKARAKRAAQRGGR